MKWQRSGLIALVIICITVILAVLAMRRDLCEVHFRTNQTEVTVSTACESKQ
ncbi:Hok/Gef family protein [Pseudocitrobacter corydidari]|jgi:protein HokC/D|uniref:Toxic protein HokC n=1 Tax=Pseudocitrobacter corydidari TaxID=2891570 RepID=A0ABY3S2A9_9ENTR|nr:Hok/Gef family protein [Pseudocitrobacter corydidari]UGS40659.1 Toxic protein HokC [Pseudocitrobacter corydidari]